MHWINKITKCGWKFFTLLLKFLRIDEIGCSILVGGTALLSFLYHLSRRLTSIPWPSNSVLNISSSELRTYVGIGRYPYFCPRNTYVRRFFFFFVNIKLYLIVLRYQSLKTIWLSPFNWKAKYIFEVISSQQVA